MWSNIGQILPNIVQKLSHIVGTEWFGFLCSGCSADAAVRARLLAVALHQDDLPPPARLLPPHPHHHPPQNH